jgi:hypothetical protein
MSQRVTDTRSQTNDDAWQPDETPSQLLGGEDDESWQDELFTVLSNHRRRYAWRCCRDAESPLELGDVAEQVAAWENDKPVAAITSAERKRVYTSLQQTHLPKMDDCGIVEFENGTVELGEAAEEFDIFLDVVPENEVPWSEYYLWLSGLSGGLLTLVWLGVYPAILSPMGWAGAIVLAFGLSAIYHTYTNRQQNNSESPPDVR